VGPAAHACSGLQPSDGCFDTCSPGSWDRRIRRSRKVYAHLFDAERHADRAPQQLEVDYGRMIERRTTTIV